MRITDVTFPDGFSLGLREIRLNRLGSVVAIAGRNGAGKSRLLRVLHAWCLELPQIPDAFCIATPPDSRIRNV